MLPVDVDGSAESSVASVSSSKRVCSDVVAGTRIGGGGAFRVFERRLRNNNGPIPVAEMKIEKLSNLS